MVLAESGSGKSPHQRPPTIWVGVPGVLFLRLQELVSQDIRPHTMSLLIDHWHGHFVIIPGKFVFQTLRSRSHLSFDVKKTPGGYSMQTSRGEPDIEIHDIDTLKPLEQILREEKRG